jgi:predicted regulator of Ras-like GTPase activity (Roadblock/LC7/MglB family)
MHMVKKEKSAQNTAAAAEPVAVGATPVNDLRACLEEIKAYKGVIGYILRNSASAVIDLKDSTKLIDYAVLSSSALDASEEFSKLFNLGKVKNIVVEGKDVKKLSMTIDENRISVFMEKKADCEKILRRLRALERN